ncbi:MAG: S53 family peptidase [Solirubrobacteraceae bacterium]
MAAAAFLVVSSSALASGGPVHPAHPAHPAHPSHPSTAAANTKAYGRYCQAESHKRSDAAPGTKGTPFSQCVVAMAHAHAALATGQNANPSRTCAAQKLSKKHVKGQRGTPYSECVSGVKRMARAMSSHAQAQASATPLAVSVPRSPGVFPARRDANTTCTLPDGSPVDFFHCYTPQDIRSAYGVDRVAPLADGSPNYGQGQTIVLVDAYGSPTAAQDLQTFHDTFFPNLPRPNFDQVFPQGNPQYHNTCSSSKGLSGPCAAANWSGEATLDIEWAYSIAPEAHIILLAVPPAETVGVQGFPNLFKAISAEIDATPPGTLFSMSFGAAEQDFGGAGAQQTAKFDAVFQKGLAKRDNFFASSGDTGTVGSSKQHKESRTFPYPTVGYPASSPYVVAVGGTQLQYGWTWTPSSNDAFNSDGSFNPAYWSSTDSGDTQAVWNESWGPISTGGGASALYPRPSWQSGVDATSGDHRLVPDTAWNAAVNGGVDVYISAYPQYNCGGGSACWQVYGGTSAASPQTAGLTALVNAARQSAGSQPIGFLDPILYQDGVGGSAYTDIVPRHYGTAPPVFNGKSVGDLVDNQQWESSVPGFPTTTGYDATTGWGAPNAPAFVQELTAQP